jgi:hypothetical protein
VGDGRCGVVLLACAKAAMGIEAAENISSAAAITAVEA